MNRCIYSNLFLQQISKLEHLLLQKLEMFEKLYEYQFAIKKQPTSNTFANIKQVIHKNKLFVTLLVISCILSFDWKRKSIVNRYMI